MTGRPRGTFSDPTTRMKAWDWLERVRQIAGVESVYELDSSPLVKDLQRGRRFEAIEKDGFDPDRCIAVGKRSLYTHVTRNIKFKPTCDAYKHPFWELLQHRETKFPANPNWPDPILSSAGLLRVEARDLTNASSLGLKWPELEENQLEKNPFLSADVVKFLTLDGLQFLLIKYRELLDKAKFEEAKYVSGMLHFATFAYGDRFHGEARDTWRYLAERRMIRWDPHWKPTPQRLLQAENLLKEGFTKEHGSRGGRPAKTPGQSASGKIERRWRRRAHMLAATIPPKHDDLSSSSNYWLVSDNVFTRWLVSNREKIVTYIRPERNNSPRNPLEIPCDNSHSRMASDEEEDSPLLDDEYEPFIINAIDKPILAHDDKNSLRKSNLRKTSLPRFPVTPSCPTFKVKE